MAMVAVQCPECRRCFVVSGRGKCACGAYLIGELSKRGMPLNDPLLNYDRVWIAIDGSWELLMDSLRFFATAEQE